MGNFNFDFKLNFEAHDLQKVIDEAFAELKNCSFVNEPDLLTKTIEHAKNSLSHNYSDIYEILNSAFNSKYAEPLKNALDDTFKTLHIQPLNTEQYPIIEFTDNELQTAENLNIDLDNYSQKVEEKENKRAFSIKSIIEIIAVLFALIGIIQSHIYHLEDQQESQEIKQQISQWTETQNKTNELLEIIVRQTSTESSPDEASD